MIISKPPNKVYDEQFERIYGRKPENKGTDGDEAADEINQGADTGSQQPNIDPD